MSLQNFSWVIPGKLAGCARPGGSSGSTRDSVSADIRELRDKGIRLLVSLTSMPRSFHEKCIKARLEHLAYPITDFEAPDSIDSFSVLIDRIISEIRNGRPVCVHCRAGVGRTGLVLACVVGRYFLLPCDKAIAAVRKTRPAVESEPQRRFVCDFLEGVER